MNYTPLNDYVLSNLALYVDGKVKKNCYLVVENKRIAEIGHGEADGIGSQGETKIDCSGKLAFPGLVNAHTHIGDSVAYGKAKGLTLKEAVHSGGLKEHILQNTPREKLVAAMRKSCQLMLDTGTVAFCDFREGGLEGIMMLKDALAGLDIRCVALGRPMSPDNVELVERHCDGINISSPFDFKERELRQIRSAADKLVATHAAEEARQAEVDRAKEFLKPNVYVHMVNASNFNGIRNVVVCPRSNAFFKLGLPNVRQMLEDGVNVALGTDNCMVNKPNMVEEMKFAYKHLRVPITTLIDMATINGAKMLNIDDDYGSITVKKSASLCFTTAKNYKPTDILKGFR